jgi:5-methylcytosine-specific restriction endonuclease McrBC regulatory subunit McrC
MVLSGMTFEFAAGDTLAPGFLVNMDAVYQDYLTALLAQEAPRFGLHLRRPGSLYLDKDRTVIVKPDIVLADDAGRVRAAFDAKYKLVDADADVYQALAYAKALNLERVLLVYPADGEATGTNIRVRNDAVEVLIRTVPVGKGDSDFADLDRRAASVARRLIREALGRAFDVAA